MKHVDEENIWKTVAYHSQGTNAITKRLFIFSRLKQHKPTSLLEEVMNTFSKVGFFAVYDGHGGDRCADYLLANMHKNICNSPEFARGEFEKAIRTGFRV